MTPTRLRLAVAMVVVVGLGALTALPVRSQTSNPIVIENHQPGTGEWQIPTAGSRLANDTNNQIKGYTSAVSVTKGASLAFFVTVNAPQTFTIAFYRMGWYGGLGGRLMLRTAAIAGVQQPACPTVDGATMLVACNWTSSYALTVPASWTDGIYLAVLSNAQGYQNYVPFVVRDDARQASLLYQQPVNTYQAYNNWGGTSLYTFNSSSGVRGYKVSFDRPYMLDGSADYFGWEIYTVQWLEQRGYDVTYATDVDAEINPNRLHSVRGVLIPGHSEYWSTGMYDAAQNARDAGVSLGFLGSDAIYWQARYEAANRVLVCYKTYEAPNPTDPITATMPVLTTTLWQLDPVNRPEQALIDIESATATGETWDDTVPFVVINSGNWVYANTGFTDGTTIPGLVGYEADRQAAGLPLPISQPGTAVLLANSPYTNVSGNDDYHNASIYQAPSGAWVFASGTQAWAWGLARPGFTNAGIQQATANVLDRFIANGSVSATSTPTATATSTPTATATMTATATATMTATATATMTATATPTTTVTATPTVTATATDSATATVTAAPTATATPMDTATAMPTATATATATALPAATATPTMTATATATPTMTATATASPTSVPNAAPRAVGPTLWWRPP
jgi:hypothetical protein